MESSDSPAIIAHSAREHAIAVSERVYREIFNATSDALVIHDAAGHILDVNARMCEMFGVDYATAVKLTIDDLSLGEAPYSQAEAETLIRRTLVDGPLSVDWRMKRRDGRLFWCEVALRACEIAGEQRVIASIRDISERYLANEARALSEQRMQALLHLNQLTNASLQEITDFALEAAVRLTQSTIGYLAFVNEDESTLIMHSWSKSAMAECATIDKPIHYAVATTGLWGEAIRQRRAIITNDYAADSPWKKGCPPGHVALRRHMNTPILVNSRIVLVAGVANKTADYDQSDVQQLALLMEGMWRLIERKRAEEERERLQAQLIQAQKMESVGRLAGGIAHDFNNMLGVILGYVELALQQTPATAPLHADLEEIQQAATQSANLTRQLLAFARQQTVAPKALDLNATVAGMLTMLRRLVGAEIALAWQPGATLWPVYLDPVQVNQVLANLCVNARDAITGNGAITLKTRNRRLDAAFCAKHPGCVPGEYVLLEVSDNGCGMGPETLDKLFEPFFTTKEFGKGTGLGLATVYGVVKQNHGFINVHSEPECGTTFQIFLPRYGTLT